MKKHELNSLQNAKRSISALALYRVQGDPFSFVKVVRKNYF